MINQIQFSLHFSSEQTNKLFHDKVTQTFTDEKFQLSFVWIVRFVFSGFCSFPYHFHLLYLRIAFFFHNQCSLQPNASHSDYFHFTFLWKFWSSSCRKFQLANLFIAMCSLFHNIPKHSILTWNCLSGTFNAIKNMFDTFSKCFNFRFISFVALFSLLNLSTETIYDRPLNVITNARRRLLKRRFLLSFRLKCQTIQKIPFNVSIDWSAFSKHWQNTTKSAAQKKNVCTVTSY